MALPALPQALTSTFFQCSLILAPLLVYGAITGSIKKCATAAGLFFALALLDTVLIFAPKLPVFSQLHWNWQGKILELVVFLVLARVFKLPTALTGFALPKKASAFAVAILLGVVYAIISGGLSASGNDVEAMAYEWTMPGLAEEVSYRGLMLAVLDQQLGRPWKILGVQTGLGAVITSLLFCFGHMMFFKNDWQLFCEPAAIPDLIFFGLMMCWLRYRYESVWPCSLLHNVGNGLPYLINAVKTLFLH